MKRHIAQHLAAAIVFQPEILQPYHVPHSPIAAIASPHSRGGSHALHLIATYPDAIDDFAKHETPSLD